MAPISVASNEYHLILSMALGFQIGFNLSNAPLFVLLRPCNWSFYFIAFPMQNLLAIPLIWMAKRCRWFSGGIARRDGISYESTLRGSPKSPSPMAGPSSKPANSLKKNQSWIQNQLLKHAPHLGVEAAPWRDGHRVLFRGKKAPLRLVQNGRGLWAQFADQSVPISDTFSDLRPAVEDRMKALAKSELVPQTEDLADRHGLTLQRVSIRSQTSRWGSCSVKGTISLNWRLIQTPDWVREYIILHELMHFHEMNHSPRFWRRVKSVCPHYQKAERWLRANAQLLRK